MHVLKYYSCVYMYQYLSISIFANNNKTSYIFDNQPYNVNVLEIYTSKYLEAASYCTWLFVHSKHNEIFKNHISSYGPSSFINYFPS